MKAGAESLAPVVVIGMGNVLLGDDGFGPSVVELLAARWELPDSRVELVDAGTPGLDLAGLLCGREVAILVDAVAATALPGELRTYRDRELPAALAMLPRVSPHDPALAEALAISRLVGGPRSVLLVGAVPQNTNIGLGLSAAMQHAVRNATVAVVAELARAGVAVRKRRHPRPSAVWWESAAPHGRDQDRGKGERY